MAAPVTATVTVLVTDLEGSTALRARLGEGDADRIRRALDHATADAIAARGGRVVKGLGDGLLATFGSATNALQAAEEIERAVARLARHGSPLRVRVGLSAGDVSWEGDDVFGLSVVEACRVCALANGGDIICADIVRALARGRGSFEFGASRSVELKGLPDPVTVCQVLPGSPDGEDLEPLFVGRSRELAEVRHQLEQAAGGRGQVVVVTGEAGVGKTSLLTAIASEARDLGFATWSGGCYQGERRPYAPWREALTEYARSVALEELGQVVGGGERLIARIAPLIGDLMCPEQVDADEVAPELERDRTHEAVVALLQRVTARSPLVLLLDDLHWADVATTELLRAIGRSASRMHLVVVAALRDVDVAATDPLRAALVDLRRQPHVRRVALAGLRPPEVADLLAAVSSNRLSPSQIQELAEQTGGNPFFLRELAKELDHHRSEAEGHLSIPDSVREVLASRIDRLGEGARRLLTAASSFEMPFPLGVASAMVGLDDDAALDALDEAMDAGVVRPAEGFDRYEFSHALFRHTIYDGINPSRRARLHRMAADVIERTCDVAARPELAGVLADQFKRSAGLPGSERGVPYALAVADQAAAAHAAAEELSAIELALRLLPGGDPQHVGLHRRATFAAVLSGIDDEQVLRHVDAAVAGDGSAEGDGTAGQFVVEVGRLAERSSRHALAWACGRRARSMVHPDDRASAVQVLAWELDEAEFLDPANPGIPVDSPRRRHLNDLVAALHPSQRPRRWYFPPDRAAVVRDSEAAGSTLWDLWLLGDLRRLASTVPPLIDQALDASLINDAVHLLSVSSRVDLVLGRLERSDAALEAAAPLVGRLPPHANGPLQYWSARSLRAYLLDDDPDGALGLIEHMLRSAGGTKALWTMPGGQWLAAPMDAWRALCHARLGRAEPAIEVVHRSIAPLQLAPPGAPNYQIFAAFVAHTLWSLDRGEHLDDLEEIVRTKVLAPDLRYPECDGRWSMAQVQALRGSDDEARHWFDAARRELTEQGAVLLLPHLDHDEALMELRLGAAGDRRNARRRLDDARRSVEILGLDRLLPRMERLSARF